MNNGFDKNKFAKSQQERKLSYICIALIGVVSIICSFFVGNGFFHALNDLVKPYDEDAEKQWQEYVDSKTPDEDDDFGVDPKDYYGSYYAEKDFVIYQIDITQSNVVIAASDSSDRVQEVLFYQYADAKYAKDTFDKECAVIIVYSGSLSNIKTLLWLSGNAENGYTFVDENEKNTFTKTPVTFDQLMNDPKDYYGVYYTSKDYVVSKVDISATKITITTGSVMVDDKVEEYQYKYYCAEYALIKYQKACDVIVAHNEGSDTMRLFWIEKENNTIGLVDEKDLSYGKKEITFEELVDDPQNYYGLYAFNANNTLTLENNSKAVFVMNGVSNTYDYFYANQEWLSLYTTADYEAAFVLFDGEAGAMQIFEIDQNGNLIYADEYTFEKQ